MIKIADLDINISDNEGNLKDIDAIKDGLTEVYGGFSIHAMSDHAIYLQGQRNMLGQIIDYLKKL